MIKIPAKLRSHGCPLAGTIIAGLVCLLSLANAPSAMADRVLPDPGNLSAFRDKQGEEFQFRITGSMTGAVWGTDVYTYDSRLAKAAIHAGLIQPGQDAIVTVRILPGQESYESSNRNGVLSRTYGPWRGSFTFVGAEVIAPPEKESIVSPPPAVPAESISKETDSGIRTTAEPPSRSLEEQVLPKPEVSGTTATEAVTQPDKADGTKTSAPVQKPEARPKSPKNDFGYNFFLWFTIIIAIGYFGGVFVLLPLVIYTHYKEKLRYVDSGSRKSSIALTPEECNERTHLILDRIESELTVVGTEDGDNWLSITNGKQAKFVKYGLDYISEHLCPTDETALERIDTVSYVYKKNTERVFTGSYWLIGCAIALAALVLFSTGGGIPPFLILHTLGIAFYIMASRTPVYTLEKRGKSSSDGCIGGFFMGLLMSPGTRIYNVYSDGSKERSYGDENTESVMTLIITIIIAMLLAFLTAFLGVINFFLNYSSSFHLPFTKTEKWYESHFNP